MVDDKRFFCVFEIFPGDVKAVGIVAVDGNANVVFFELVAFALVDDFYRR